MYLLRLLERHATAEHKNYFALNGQENKLDKMWDRMLQHVNLIGCGIECFSIVTILLPLHICIGCWSIVSNVNVSPCITQLSST
ncbi:hypothetical protein QL285_047436 [Trifolium repens]|nr:hypothetical protein QL285_047436 [Trifolium repens]